MGWATKWVGLAVGVVVGVGVGGWLALRPEPLAELDPATERAVLLVIDAELERGPWPGMLESERPELGPRWFCVERVIEVRRAGDELEVGIEAQCDELARSGREVLSGSGEHGPKVVVLVAEQDGYRVDRVDVPPDGPGFVRWVEDNFSDAGRTDLYGWALSEDPNLEQARRTFGLPADAPVRPA
jgi:hypothetical protein